jgi:RNA polymerase sporulation-specific sigma factor
MGLVYTQLHKFGRANDDEAYSCAVDALVRAIDTYDDSKNITFATYASVCIYNAIGDYLRRITKKSSITTVSYNDPIYPGSNQTYFDTLQDESNVVDDVLTEELYGKLWEAFDKAYAGLTSEQAKLAIDCWRESEFTATQSDIARAVGLTQSYVSRVLSAFKHKIKIELEEYLCGK